MSILRILPVFIVAALMLGAFTAPAMAGVKHHKIAIHIDESEKGKMNLVLNNAENLAAYYKAKGETIDIEIVAYGPGLQMLVEKTSPVKQRIAAMSLENENLTFSACAVTMEKMAKKTGKKIKLVSEAVSVPGGVVRLMELQEAGWAYLRP